MAPVREGRDLVKHCASATSDRSDERGVIARRITSAAALASVMAVLHVAAFWPGIMVWDAIRQYGQALSGRYDDWHPPAMNWLWRQLLPIHAGPAPMLALQVFLYWSGIGLLAAHALCDRRRRLAATICVVALMPIALVLVGTVLKDSLMAGALLTATGLLAWRKPENRWLGSIAALLMLASATLRFNAMPACLPLALASLPAGWRARRGPAIAAGIGIATALMVAIPLANRLLRAEPSGVGLSLVIYDLGGIGRNSATDTFPPVAVADPVALNARCYSPVAWDSYAWWVDAPCPIGFENIRGAFLLRRQSPTRFWLAAIARHPIAYLRHRLEHFAHNIRLIGGGTMAHGLTTRSDPNRWSFTMPPSRLREAVVTLANASLATPLGWPVCWLALALGVLVACPRDQAGLARPLAWSALLYGFSYLPLSVATEVRYHFWTTTAAALAIVLTIDALARRRQLARLRMPAVWVPVAIVTVVAIAARL